MHEQSIVDILDPHWWTFDHVVTGFFLTMIAIAIVRQVIRDSH